MSASTSSSSTTSTTTTGARPQAADWEGMWKNGIKQGERFDITRSHKMLDYLIANDTSIVPVSGRCLVPGVGRGYDLAALASPTRFVTGLDISPTCVAEAKQYLETTHPEKKGQYEALLGDFFEYTPSEPFDLIYDYTFLCALPIALRKDWAAKMASLLKSHSILVTLQFPLGAFYEPHPKGKPLDYTRGPPFLLSKELYVELLSADFELIMSKDVPEEMSDPKRAGVEAVAVWKRK
jgi:hypothetical protein